MRSWFPANCHFCESAWSVRGLLCEHCWSRALRRPAGHVRVEGLDVYYLTEWVPEENPPLSVLARALKGSREGETWRHLAALFFDAHFRRARERVVLVPCPARIDRDEESPPDHAGLFAQGLSEIAGLQSRRLLLHSSGKKQKSQGRSARKARSFGVIEDGFDARQRYVFIDDILTTGATASAALKALGSPGRGEVWCFAYRSLPRGEGFDRSL